MTFFMRAPICAGDREMLTPAASSALILSVAVPLPPEMMAPACPIRRPGGAVRPADMTCSASCRCTVAAASPARSHRDTCMHQVSGLQTRVWHALCSRTATTPASVEGCRIQCAHAKLCKRQRLMPWWLFIQAILKIAVYTCGRGPTGPAVPGSLQDRQVLVSRSARHKRQQRPQSSLLFRSACCQPVGWSSGAQQGALN